MSRGERRLHGHDVGYWGSQKVGRTGVVGFKVGERYRHSLTRNSRDCRLDGFRRAVTHGVPTSPRMTERQIAARKVGCSCGWAGRIGDLVGFPEPNLVAGMSIGFPECPTCLGGDGELHLL